VAVVVASLPGAKYDILRICCLFEYSIVCVALYSWSAAAETSASLGEGGVVSGGLHVCLGDM
jgi:hypothetical protein